jgi:hypothetical protein
LEFFDVPGAQPRYPYNLWQVAGNSTGDKLLTYVDYSGEETAIVFLPFSASGSLTGFSYRHVLGSGAQVNSFEVKFHGETVYLLYSLDAAEHPAGAYLCALPITDILSTTEFRPDLPQAISVSVHPNPFNQEATIELDLTRSGQVNVAVFDLLGRRLEMILSDNLSAGSHRLHWNAVGEASGLYFLRAEAQGQQITQKLMLLK